MSKFLSAAQERFVYGKLRQASRMDYGKRRTGTKLKDNNERFYIISVIRSVSRCPYAWLPPPSASESRSSTNHLSFLLATVTTCHRWLLVRSLGIALDLLLSLFSFVYARRLPRTLTYRENFDIRPMTTRRWTRMNKNQKE